MKLQRKIHKSTIPTGYKFLAIGGSGSGKNNEKKHRKKHWQSLIINYIQNVLDTTKTSATNALKTNKD